MEGKDAARHRIGIGVVAKQRLRARGNIFEADLTLLADEVLRHVRDVAGRLLGEARKRGALRFGFDHPAELPTNEQAIVYRPRGGLEFPYRHAESGAKVHFSLGLDQPSTSDKPPVDQRPRLILGMEGGFAHLCKPAGWYQLGGTRNCPRRHSFAGNLNSEQLCMCQKHP